MIENFIQQLDQPLTIPFLLLFVIFMLWEIKMSVNRLTDIQHKILKKMCEGDEARRKQKEQIYAALDQDE